MGRSPRRFFRLHQRPSTTPRTVLGQLVPRRSKPILEERIIRAIVDRGSEIWDGDTFSLAELRLDSQGRAESVDAYIGSYYDMVCSASYLDYELLAALQEMEDRPFALELLPVRRQALSLYPTPARACWPEEALRLPLGFPRR